MDWIEIYCGGAFWNLQRKHNHTLLSLILRREIHNVTYTASKAAVLPDAPAILRSSEIWTYGFELDLALETEANQQPAYPVEKILALSWRAFIEIMRIIWKGRVYEIAFQSRKELEKYVLEIICYETSTATATLDPTHICDLHHSLRHRRILNPLSEARDWARVLMDTVSGS